jgi:hypothetical protein
MNEFQINVKYSKPKIVILTETRQTVDDIDTFLNIQNYSFVRCDASNRHTGGVMIYVSNIIKFKEITNYRKNMTWLLSIEIIGGFKKGIYGAVYKSPQEKMKNFMTTIRETTNLI